MVTSGYFPLLSDNTFDNLAGQPEILLQLLNRVTFFRIQNTVTQGL